MFPKILPDPQDFDIEFVVTKARLYLPVSSGGLLREAEMFDASQWLVTWPWSRKGDKWFISRRRSDVDTLEVRTKVEYAIMTTIWMYLQKGQSFISHFKKTFK